MRSYKSRLYCGIGSLGLIAGIFIADTDINAQAQDVEAINAQMKNTSPSVRAKMVEILGEMGVPSVVAVLVEALGDEASQVRREAAQELGELGDPMALQDTDRNVRREAADALGEIKASSAVEALIEALSDDARAVRR